MEPSLLPFEQYVLQTYGDRGVELKSKGDICITLLLPPMLENVEILCADLHEKYGTILDLEILDGNMQLCCYPTKQPGQFQVPRAFNIFLYLISAIVILSYTSIPHTLSDIWVSQFSKIVI